MASRKTLGLLVSTCNMGMYDIVEIGEDLDLPGFEGTVDKIGWQTKSLDQSLDVYKITSNNLLRKETKLREATEEEKLGMVEAVGYDSLEEIDNSLLRELVDNRRVVDDSWWEEKDYTGVVEFYGSTENGERYEYQAEFVSGSLEDITRL